MSLSLLIYERSRSKIDGAYVDVLGAIDSIPIVGLLIMKTHAHAHAHVSALTRAKDKALSGSGVRREDPERET